MMSTGHQVSGSSSRRCPRDLQAGHGFAIGLTLLGFATTCTCSLFARHAYFHLDDVTHFLYAKWTWHWPRYLLDDWGRPGFTVAYFIPAAFGWTACRIFSSLLTALAAWFAYLTARRVGLSRAWLVIPLCYAQPLIFLLSQTTLTEIPLAFYLSFATWLAVSRRWTWSSIVLSAAFVTRHEAICFLPVWMWFAWRDRARWYSLLPLFWAPIIVNGMAASLGMSNLVLRLLNPTPTHQYGHGGWLTYFLKSLHAFGPAVAVLAIIGLRGFLRNPAAKLVAAIVVIYFLAETIVFRFGLFASGGYSRFLVAIGPLVAILAVNGTNRLLNRDPAVWRRAAAGAAAAMLLLWISTERQLQLQHGTFFDLPETYRAIWSIRVATAVLVMIAAVAYLLSRSAEGRRQHIGRALVPCALALLLGLTAYVFHHPLKEPPDAKLIDGAMARLDAMGLGKLPIVTAHPYVELRAGEEISPYRPNTRRRVAEAPIGSLIVWESQLTPREGHNLQLNELRGSTAFQEVLHTSPLPYQRNPYLYIFRKIGQWHAG